MRIAALWSAFVAVAVVATSAAVPRATAFAASRRVLFIGNSLTTANNLPRLVEQLSQRAGAPIVATVVAFGDYSLSDHWDRGDALTAIRRGGWDTVVLQQGPSSLPESRRQLMVEAKRFDGEIRTAGARTALYMVWPPKNRLAFFDDVSRSYTDAAEAVHALLLPAGDAWREAWNRDPSLPLYGPDDFHPSVLGSTLAAEAIVRGIIGR